MSVLAEHVLIQGLDHCQVLACGSRGRFLCELFLLLFQSLRGGI